VLTHYGRKTGKAYRVTIWFVLDGENLYIGSWRTVILRLRSKCECFLPPDTREINWRNSPSVLSRIHGPLIHAANSILVMSVHIGAFRESDTDLKRWATLMTERNGKNAKTHFGSCYSV
jgi:hypothetical protein